MRIFSKPLLTLSLFLFSCGVFAEPNEFHFNSNREAVDDGNFDKIDRLLIPGANNYDVRLAGWACRDLLTAHSPQLNWSDVIKSIRK